MTSKMIHNMRPAVEGPKQPNLYQHQQALPIDNYWTMKR